MTARSLIPIRHAMAAALAVLLATPATAQLTHRRTIPDYRASSLAYDAVICGVWVASEGPTLILLNASGAELRRIEGGLPSVRSLTVEGDALLVTDGWGRFARVTREGQPIDAPFRLGETLRDTEGLHRDADGSFLIVEDDPARLLRVAPDGRVLTVTPLSPYGFDPEGVPLQPETGTLFVGFGSGRALSIFDWQPSRTTIDTPLERGPDCATV